MSRGPGRAPSTLRPLHSSRRAARRGSNTEGLPVKVPLAPTSISISALQHDTQPQISEGTGGSVMEHSRGKPAPAGRVSWRSATHANTPGSCDGLRGQAWQIQTSWQATVTEFHQLIGSGSKPAPLTHATAQSTGPVRPAQTSEPIAAIAARRRRRPPRPGKGYGFGLVHHPSARRTSPTPGPAPTSAPSARRRRGSPRTPLFEVGGHADSAGKET